MTRLTLPEWKRASGWERAREDGTEGLYGINHCNIENPTPVFILVVNYMVKQYPKQEYHGSRTECGREGAHGMPERPGERMKPRVLEQMSVSGKRVSQESYD